MLDEDDIREALRDCYDTQLFGRPINIVDLGLVETIALSPDPEAPGSSIPGVPQRQRVTLTLLTASDENARAQLSALISNRLAGIPELWRNTIQFAADPPWTRARITPQGRALLQLDFPILNNR